MPRGDNMSIRTAGAEAGRGKRATVYLFVGDEFLTREAVKALVDTLLPATEQSWSVETVGDDEAASVAGRLRMVPLFGGLKIVVVRDTKAFVSKQNVGELFRRSYDAWTEGDHPRATRHLALAMSAAGQDRAVVERGARGQLSAAAREQLVGFDDDASARWLQETCARLAAEGGEPTPAGGAAVAAAYENVIAQGIPSEAVLILTAEVVDQRRALFKRVAANGVVVDCGVRTGKAGETQMRPEVARARIRQAAERAGKRIDDEVLAAIVDRTGFSVRMLESEMEKLFLYVGDRSDVRKSDVLAVLSTSRESSIFDLTSALEARDAACAIQALRALAAQREAAQPVLGMIASTIRSLLVARIALDARLRGTFDGQMTFGAFQGRVLPRITAAEGPDDGSAAKMRDMHPFRAYNLCRAAVHFTQAELLAALGGVHDADLVLKTTAQPEAGVLEGLVLAMCRDMSTTH